MNIVPKPYDPKDLLKRSIVEKPDNGWFRTDRRSEKIGRVYYL